MLYKLKQCLLPLRIQYAEYKARSAYEGEEDIDVPMDLQVANFEKKRSESQLNVISDLTIGGASRGALIYSDTDQSVTFLGQIKKEKANLSELPFAGFEYPFIINTKVDAFNVLRLKLRTDGKSYKVRVGLTSNYEYGQHQVYGYIVDQSQQWNTYEIQFKDLAFDDVKEKAKVSLEPHSQQLKLISIQILKESKIDEKFALQIKEISFAQTILSEQKLTFRKPIFYLADREEMDFGNPKYTAPVIPVVKESVKKLKREVNNFF